MTYLNIVEDSRATNLHILHAWMLWIVFGAGRMKDALWMKAKQIIVSCDYKSVFLVRHGKDLCHCGNLFFCISPMKGKS